MTLHSRFTNKLVCLCGALLLTVAITACRVHEQGEGNNKKVDIATPFGGIKVNTDVAAKDTGLPVYPGAKEKPSTEHDSHSANVNLSFGDFGLKVVALTYTSSDSPDKILDFYRKEMKTYGGILECKGGNISFHRNKDKDSKELTCDEKGNGDTTELKVGTEDHQRVVAVKPISGGTEFSLVLVHTKGKEGTL